MKNAKILQLIALVVFSLLGGIAGDLIFRNYIYTAYNLPLLGDIDYSGENYRGTNLIIRDAQRVIVEQNEKVKETIANVRPSLVGIFKKAENNPQTANYYVNDEYAQGIIITSDGWIMTSLPKDGPQIDLIRDYIIATRDNKIFAIDNLARDRLTGATYVHISARGLPVRNFIDRGNLGVGDTVIANNWDNSSAVTQVTRSDFGGGANKDSDLGLRSFGIKDSGSSIKDYFIFDFSGNYIGYIDKIGELQCILGSKAAIASLLKDGSIQRARLGITFLPVEKLINYPFKSGMLVKSVKKDSPAFRAGIQEGFIVTAVNGTQLSLGYDLADAVVERQPGEKIILSYTYKNLSRDAGITLGELEIADQ